MKIWPAYLFAALVAQLCAASSSPPLAKTLNGTYRGRYVPEWDQDLFLGMPFAQPPTGQLRFRWPQSLNTSFSGVRDAVEYGDAPMQVMSSYYPGGNMSEDCLTVNVVRPTGDYKDLPVLVWIYGGGFIVGGSAYPQYNLSGIVKVSQDMGQPIIAVSFNYRLQMYGFLQSQDLLNEGSSNAGLLDQRMALRWVQDNIEAFNGDPEKVVIWGESSGAQSVGYQLFSYGGRDDGLYRGAILESGGPRGTQVPYLTYYAVAVENLAKSVGCSNANNQLVCLRSLSQDQLWKANQEVYWNPLIDGDFLTAYPSQLMLDNNFVKVPLLLGTNTDEGITFSATGVNNDKELFDVLMTWRQYALSPPHILRLMELYPNDPCSEPPFDLTNCSEIFPANGLMWRRAAAIGGDMVMMSGRRNLCELFSRAGLDVYSYRFDTRLWNYTRAEGVPHFVNVAFSFQNITGLLGPFPEYKRDAQLSRAIGEAYVRFVYSLDPNPAEGRTVSRRADPDIEAMKLPHWPKYNLDKPENMVLNATHPYVEPDTWRKDGIAFMNTYDVSRELLS